MFRCYQPAHRILAQKANQRGERSLKSIEKRDKVKLNDVGSITTFAKFRNAFLRSSASYHRTGILLASDNGSNGILINDSLRKLYLKVHPDFFSRWPEAQNTNEKSFQQLMSFLDDMEESNNQVSPGLLIDKKQYPITFYLKTNTNDIVDNDAESLSHLQKISINLKISNDPDSALYDGLARLFDLCDIEHSISKSSGRPLIKKTRGWADEFSLAHFSRKCHEIARARSQERLKIERDLDIERTVFFIQHRIRVATELPEELASDWRMRVDTERALLRKLENVLKTLYFDKKMDLETLANCTICFGNRAGITTTGRIGLKIVDSPEQWVECLYNIDTDLIESMREGSANRFDKEKQIGEAIGIAYFYTDSVLANTPKYIQYLESIEAQAKKDGVYFQDMSSINVRVLEAQMLPETIEEAIKSDYSRCAIATPLNLPPTSLFEWISKYGHQLIQEFDAYNRENEDMNSLILSAKRKFRLRSLTWNPNLTKEQLKTCVTGIVRYAPILSRQFEGQRIKVDEEYDVSESDGTIHIKWNFVI